VRAATAVAAALALPALANRAALSTLRMPLNYNEGWNAYHALEVVRGGALYPAADALLPNNYPPLSFHVVAAVGRLTGDLIVAGRLVAWAAFAVVLVNIWLAASALARSRGAGAFAVALFAAMMGAFYARYVGIDDPQMLGHALMTSALVLCVRRWESNGALAGALVLALSAGLVKHNLLAFPIALAVAAVVSDRRRGTLVVLGGAGLAALTIGLLYLGYGRALFQGLLAAREYSAYDAMAGARQHLVPQVPLLACVVAAFVTWPRRGPELLLLAYAAVAMVIAVPLAGGAGVRENIYFDVLIAGCIVAAVVAARAVEWGEAPRGRPLAAVLPFALVLAPLVGGLPIAAELKWRWLDGEARTAVTDTGEDTAMLRAAPGSAMCESLALCYWAGQPGTVDLFNAHQAFRTGRLDRELLLTRIRAGEFGTIQLAAGNSGGERWDDALHQAVQSRYRLARTSMNGFFYTPR
jgi:hypothetical protein